MLLTFCTKGFKLLGREAVGCDVRGFIVGWAAEIADTAVTFLAIQLSMSCSWDQDAVSGLQGCQNRISLKPEPSTFWRCSSQTHLAPAR